MTASRSGRTVVVGLGNPVLTDDRVGLAVAAALAGLLGESPVEDVDVLTGTRGGFELLDLLSGYRRAILVDALTLPHPRPGRVRRLGPDRLAGSARLVNPHEISLADAFHLAERMSIPMPASVEILAVEAGDTTTLSEQMTPAVDRVVQPLARRIHRMLLPRGRAVLPRR
jgi:hydrogenase maturation protease